MTADIYEYAQRIIDNDHHDGKMIQEMAKELLQLQDDYYQLADEKDELLAEMDDLQDELDEVYRASQHI